MYNIYTKHDKRTFNYEEGVILLVDKPKGWTSFDVVNKLRFASKVKKIGHAGTLDPLATGLLVVCVGRKATRLIDSLQGMDKEYTGSIYLGATTPSYDLETEINATFDISNINTQAVEDAATALTGTYLQTAPIYSALKVDGKRMYKLARKGKTIKPKERPVTVHAFNIEKIEWPQIYFRIACGKGTYIRSIAYDLGQRLQNGAYLSSLRRTKIGNFDVQDAWNLEELVASIHRQRGVIP